MIIKFIGFLFFILITISGFWCIFFLFFVIIYWTISIGVNTIKNWINEKKIHNV
ncbi:serine hydroxymethyltransferase [Blattabacterium punctulatus]|nr:serine hydroxymethyltransferase [Blattabacterium punctulatus]AWU45554.1 serine hydroxymethyltransferase [Blattabacterium punctulatus]